MATDEGLCTACSATGPCLEHEIVYALGARKVRVLLRRDGTVMRNHRGRVAVRNCETNRLTYVADWRLKPLPRSEVTR